MFGCISQGLVLGPLVEFPGLSQSILHKWCGKLEFSYKWCNKKMQLYKQFDVGVVDPACNFTKNDNLQQVPGMGILPISYLLSGVLLIVSENNSESNERRIFAQKFSK